MKNIQSYYVVFREEPEGGFTALVPSLPGCISYGKTIEQARTMITDAISGYLFVMKKNKKHAPIDTNVFGSMVNVTNKVYA